MTQDIFQFAPFAFKKKRANAGLQIFRSGEEGVFLNMNPITYGLFTDTARTTPANNVGQSVAGLVIPGVVNMPYIQATTARMPTIASDSGRTGLFFDGVDDNITSTDIPTRDFFVNKPAQGFVMCAKWISGSRYFRWHNPLATGSVAAFSFEQSATQAVMHTSPMFSSTTYTATVNYNADSNYHIWQGQANYTTGELALWRDGVKIYSANVLPIGLTSTTSPTTVDMGYRTATIKQGCNMNAIGFWRTPMSDTRMTDIYNTVKQAMGL